MNSVKLLFRKFAGMRDCNTCDQKLCGTCSNLLADGSSFDEIQALYRNASVGLALFSRDLRWVRINAQLAEINGHPIEAHIGAHIDDLIPELAPLVRITFAGIFETGRPVENLKMSGATPARPGIVRHWTTSYYPISNTNEDVVAILAVVSEETGRILAEQNAIKSEAQLQLALTASGIGVWSWNLSTGAMTRSHLPMGDLGYSEAQTSDELFLESLIYKQDAERLRREISLHIKGHIAEIDFEYRVKASTGRWVWFRIRGKALATVPGEAHFVVAGTYENIDTAKAAARDAELLRTLSLRLSYIHSRDEMMEIASAKLGRRLEADYVSLVSLDRESGRFKHESHWKTDRIMPVEFTLDPEALPPEIVAPTSQGLPFVCEDLERDRPFGDHQAAKVLRTRRVQSLVIVPQLEKDVVTAGFVIQTTTPRAWLNREIEFVQRVQETLFSNLARVSAEARADSSQRLLSHASILGGVAVFDHDYESGTKFASSGFDMILGKHARAEDKFDKYFSLIHPEDLSSFRAALLKARDPKGDGLCLHDHRLLLGEQDVHWMQFRGQNVFSEDGIIQRWLGAVVEVTEQRMLQRNAEDADQRYRLAGMVSHDIIWDRDQVSGHCLWSIAINTLLGYRLQDEATSLDWVFDHVHKEDRKRVESSFGKALRSHDENWSSEYRIKKSDGSYADVLDRCIFVRNEDGSARRAVGVIHDMTEQRAAADKIKRQQIELERVARLGTMGAMASTLAHELNQPLAAASNYLAVLGALEAQGSPGGDSSQIAKVAGMAGDQVRRAGDIIRRMRDFTLTGAIVAEKASLHALIARSIAQIKLHPDAAPVTFAQSISDRVDMILMDPIQIEQVVANILRNAVEALKGADQPTIEITVTSADKFAEIVIADNGKGLSDEALKDLFQPFKSTKENGLGLGLAICRTIVEAHGGKLTAEQGVDCGAIFHVTLPMNDGSE